MTKGVSLTGKLDTNYWVKQINNSKNKQDAINTIKSMMDAADKFGITDNDQKAVTEAIQTYSTKYNTNMDRVLRIWDPSQNHINSAEYKYGNYANMFETTANDPNVYFSGESVDFNASSKDLQAAINRNSNNKKTTITTNAGNWITNPSTPPTVTPAKIKKQQQEDSKRLGSGNSTPSFNIKPLEDLISNQNKIIQDLKDEMYELKHPKVYTADELAEHYGVQDQYNTDYWLNLYNDKTNKYYDDAVAEQQRIREQSAIDQNNYSLDLMDQYNAASKNSVGSSLNRGIRNIVGEQSSWGMAKTNSDNDYGMLKSIYQLDEDRKAELANNPDLARQAYTALGTKLMDLGVTHNKSDVENYYHTLINYMNNYTTARNASAALANASASRYSGLANAAGLNATSSSNKYNNELYQQLYETINQMYANTGKSNSVYLNITGQNNK